MNQQDNVQVPVLLTHTEIELLLAVTDINFERHPWGQLDQKAWRTASDKLEEGRLKIKG